MLYILTSVWVLHTLVKTSLFHTIPIWIPDTKKSGTQIIPVIQYLDPYCVCTQAMPTFYHSFSKCGLLSFAKTFSIKLTYSKSQGSDRHGQVQGTCGKQPPVHGSHSQRTSSQRKSSRTCLNLLVTVQVQFKPITQLVVFMSNFAILVVSSIGAVFLVSFHAFSYGAEYSSIMLFFPTSYLFLNRPFFTFKSRHQANCLIKNSAWIQIYFWNLKFKML